MATRVAAAGGGVWSAGATWVGGVAPTAADDVQLNATSGAVTIDAGAACRSLDCTGYVSTLTHTAAVTLSIGDATAGLSNIALKFVAGMTYTLGNATTSAITFVSTSATQQTIDWGGKTFGNLSWNGAGGSWIFSSALATSASSGLTLGAGSLDTNGQTFNCGTFNASNVNTRSLSLGASAITFTGTWNLTTTTNLTFNAGTSTITCNNGNSNFQGGSLTYNNVVLTPNSGSMSTTGSNTFANFTVGGQNNGRVVLGGDVVVTGLFTASSASSTNMAYLNSSVRGTQRTVTAASVTISNISFQDILAAGASAPWTTTTNLGDMGGNSNITFTAPVTRFWVATTGGNWNATSSWSATSGGASGVSIPLPQDTVVFDANSITSAGRTITWNVQCNGTIDFSNILNTPTIAQTITNGIIFVRGDLAYATGMTLTGTTPLQFHGSGSNTITTRGVTITNSLTFDRPSTTYTLQDDLTCTNTLTLNFGTVDFNNRNVSALSFSSTNSQSRQLNMGSGTFTLTGTGSVWNTTTNTNMTLNPGTSTILVSDTSATAKTFSGGGMTFNNFTVTPGGTGAVQISSGNSFNVFTCTTGPKSLIFNNGNATRVNTWNVSGSLGNIITITSNNAGTATTISDVSGINNSDYLSLQDNIVTGGALWYAGVNSTAVSNVSGWQFKAAPVTGSTGTSASSPLAHL